MAGFSVALVVAGALFGALVRARLHFVSPLPSDDAVLWFLTGALQDVAVMAAAGAGALLFARTLGGKLAAILLAAFFDVFCLTSFVWSEALAYFGHPPRRGEMGIAATGSFLLKSADKGAVLRLALAIVLVHLLIGVAWVAGRRMSGVKPARLLAIAAGAMLLIALPVPVHLHTTASNPVFALVALAREAPVGAVPPPAFKKLTASGAAVHLPPARQVAARSSAAPFLSPGTKPNVVFLLLEGVRSNELGAWGGPFPALSPRLDDLARRGVRVDRAYSPGTHTPEGELALWYGLFAAPQMLVLTDRPDIPKGGLPERLRAAGWKSLLWVHNGDQTFYRRDRFYPPRGFRVVDGRDFPATDPRTNWGYSDLALAHRGLEALDRAEEPFAAMLLTVSNHHPFQVPSDAKTSFDIPATARAGFVPFGLGQMLGLHTVPMLKTIHYTDEAVGAFMDGAASKPWFGRTVFVVCGDHGLPIAPLSGSPTPHQYSELRHRVPLIIFSPLLKGGETIDGPASLADVPSTLLGLAGLPGPAGAGRDLLDPASSDPDRPVIAWNDEGQTVTIATRRFVYHATVASDANGGVSLADELLIAEEDREGKENLASKESAALESFRATAKQYVIGYFPSLSP
jgi:phosphoglycerol transferase MdoB-like AlkP superfamily enzyme